MPDEWTNTKKASSFTITCIKVEADDEDKNYGEVKLTISGASANITGIGILRKAGYEVKNKDFFRIGIPFTLAAIVPAYIIIWLFFGV